MRHTKHPARVGRILAATLFLASVAPVIVPAHAQSTGSQPESLIKLLPTGVFVSPGAIPGSSQQALTPSIASWPAGFAASEAVKSALSPDGSTLAIVTAGYNDTTLTDGSELQTQFVFIYDVSGARKAAPQLAQVITQNNAFAGLVWSGNTTLYASGGLDDKVYVYTRADAAPSTPFAAAGAIALGHGQGIGISTGENVGGL
ncbi:MAG: hypothetical protein FWD17_08930, partial [Polyangiaceae bacterium]|nr:hypothetical protein [Polyangiaceae bacterium]